MPPVNLRLIAYGETVVTVPDREYADARRGGTLDALLVEDVDRMVDVVDAVAVAPDGTVTELTGLSAASRPSMLGGWTMAVLEDLIASAQPVPDCDACQCRSSVCATHTPKVCPRHMAEHLLRLARQEGLLLVPLEAMEAVAGGC